MTAPILWSQGIKTFDYDSERFLCYYKNDAILHGSTLYENALYETSQNDNIDIVHIRPLNSKYWAWGQEWICSDTPIGTEIEYAELNNWTWPYQHPDLKISKSPLKRVFESVIQYRLRFLYNISEEITKEQAKQKLLYALTDKIFGNEAILSPLMFFNRQNINKVSLEIFLFCASEIDIKYLTHLGECEYEKSESPIIIEKLTKAQALYWHYRWYCELFLNKNILSASAFFLMFIAKPKNYTVLWEWANEDRHGILAYDKWWRFKTTAASLVTLLLVTVGATPADAMKEKIDFATQNPYICLKGLEDSPNDPQFTKTGDFTHYWWVARNNYWNDHYIIYERRDIDIIKNYEKELEEIEEKNSLKERLWTEEQEILAEQTAQIGNLLSQKLEEYFQKNPAAR